MPQRTREIHLAARPEGEPKPSDFDLVETDLPDPGDNMAGIRRRTLGTVPGRGIPGVPSWVE